MLFSEPKIPQFQPAYAVSSPALPFQCSSASRKFLNFEVANGQDDGCCVSVLFSEPKIPQSVSFVKNSFSRSSFSALQRAENSSIPVVQAVRPARVKFQCSSASRKFLNVKVWHGWRAVHNVSVLFSEPKIPQWHTNSTRRC